MSIELMMPSSHLILCHLLLLLFSIFPTQGLFQSVGCYCSFSFSISPSDEYSGLISFRIDWFDLLCPRNSQEYFPLPQFESISSLVLSLLYSQLSHLQVTTGKTIALTIQTFVGKMMSLLLNMLSRFVIAFLPRIKHLLVVQLPLPSTMILESKKIKSVTAPTFSPSICHEVMGPDAMILVF